MGKIIDGIDQEAFAVPVESKETIKIDEENLAQMNKNGAEVSKKIAAKTVKMKKELEEQKKIVDKEIKKCKDSMKTINKTLDQLVEQKHKINSNAIKLEAIRKQIALKLEKF